MQIEINCHFCFELFEIMIEPFNGSNLEIWDCEICCNPNKVSYNIQNGELFYINISSGNE